MMADLQDADPTMLSHVAAFRERGTTEPHEDCSWCQDAVARGLWDAPLPRYRVTYYYEAEVDVAAFSPVHARERGELQAEPALVESHVVDLAERQEGENGG